MFYTYLHRRNDTGAIFYVGKGSSNRAYSVSSRSKHWLAIYRKHGRTVEICANWNSEEEAHAHEILLIEALKSIGEPLVNHTDGGDGVSGYRHSQQSIDAMRTAHLMWWSDESNKLAAVQRIKTQWSNPAWRAGMVDRLIDRTRDPEIDARRKAGIARANLNPEVRARKSAAQTLAQRKPETVRKQRLSRLTSNTPGGRSARSVLCLNTGDFFESAADAGRYFGVQPSNVASACRGERSGVSGLQFSYMDSSPLLR